MTDRHDRTEHLAVTKETHRRGLVLLAMLTALGLLLLLASSAKAVPVWNLDLHHNQTNFAPGGTGQYWPDLRNVGDTDTNGTITLTVTLPKGLTRDAVYGTEEPGGKIPNIWSCPGSPGDKSFICTSKAPIPAHLFYDKLALSVDVAPGASGEPVASAKVEGGGAVSASTKEPTPISSQPAGFGIFAPSFTPDFFRSDGLTPEREAGAHPELFTIPFDFNSVDLPNAPGSEGRAKVESETIRDLRVDTPPGFIGNPTVVGDCSQAAFVVNDCPPSSLVGRIEFTVVALSTGGISNSFIVDVYNLSHPRGFASDLGFSFVGNPVHVRVSLDPANRYAITSSVQDINETLPPFDNKLTLWGVPADPSHDSLRCRATGCSVQGTPRPFLSLPSQCETDNAFRLHHYDSWQNPGAFGPDISYPMPGKMTACDKPRFEPEVEIVPTGRQANTPTGLDVHIKVAQNENPNALATPPVKDTTVTLPQGMSFSPSFADGLQSCSLAQIKLETNEPIACPDASRIGEVTLNTPLLPKAAEGSMYLAAQGDNPFGSLFALYLVLHDVEQRGILIKIPGRVDVDPLTGQITTVFEDTPQFPFDELALKFRSGSRAPLVNPPSCGEHTIGVQLASYAQPDKLVDVSNTYRITEGPNGTPCPPDSAHRPFAPAFSGGTLNPVAGSYSTFLFRLSREDQEQELSQVTSVLPPGLVAKIAGIPFCPDAALASIATELGTGAIEAASPACPGASQIGTISAGLGAGPGPNYFPGRVYLAGPYKGAPLSLAIVVPALAGPFDLGNSVVRAALRVHPDTTRVTAVSDPFPTILHGVLLRVRDVRLRIDRPQTTINPTNCGPLSLNAQITGVGGQLLSTADDSLFTSSDPFQVGECGRLGFKPKLTFRLKGGTNRGDHPAFSSLLTYPKGGGYANIAKAVVALPHSEFLENAHIRTICTRVQFAGDACPAASVYGFAIATTPLLDQPVEGPVILRSSDHPLPDLVAKLRGQISANLIGRIDSVNGGIRTTFDSVPDVPVSQFTLSMAGGKKGLFVNSRNLCKAPSRADVRFTAQSGKRVRLRPPMQNDCKVGKDKHKLVQRRVHRRG
jgi:hypothetical protein